MWPQPVATEELLNQVRQGRAGAVDQLLAQHRDRLRRLIELRLDAALGRRVDASDIVQEVLLGVSKRLEDYLRNPAMPFHLWMRQIALDRIRDAHRRHRQAQRRSLDREQPLRSAAFADRSSLQLGASLVDPEMTPAARAVRQELERRFVAALASLEEDDREIIQMRHFDQLSNQETAAALGLSEAAAGMRYLRAIRRIRQQLASDQPSVLDP